MSTRVYVPGDWDSLGEVVGAGRGTGDPDRSISWSGRAHAVTAGLRAQWPDGDEEEWEYAAAQEAANDSLAGFRDEGEPARRLVLAVDVDAVQEVTDGRATEVEVTDVEVPADVVAYLVDDAGAADDVRAAERLVRNGGDPADLEAALDRCSAHELAWYDASELDVVLALG